MPIPEINKITEPRDNTITRFSSNNFTPVSLNNNEKQFYENLEKHVKDSRLDDGPMGLMPVVGDVLQGAQAINSFNNGNYLDAGVTAGLLFVPNFIEKTIKPFAKSMSSKVASTIKNTEKNWFSIKPAERRSLIRTGVNSAPAVTGGIIGASTTDSDSQNYWKDLTKRFLIGSTAGYTFGKIPKINNKLYDNTMSVINKAENAIINGNSPSIFFDRLAGNLPPMKFDFNKSGIKIKPIQLSDYKSWVSNMKKQLDEAIKSSGNTPSYGIFNFNTNRKEKGWIGLTTTSVKWSEKDPVLSHLLTKSEVTDPKAIRVQLALRDRLGRFNFDDAITRNGVMVHENRHAADWLNGTSLSNFNKTTWQTEPKNITSLEPLIKRSDIKWFSDPNEWRAEFENYNYLYNRNPDKVKSAMKKRFGPLHLSDQDFDQVYQEIQSLYNKDHGIH